MRGAGGGVEMGELNLGQDKFPRGRAFVLFIFARYRD